jgi:hypothetical protein
VYGIYVFIYIYVHLMLWNQQIWKIKKKSGPPYAEGIAVGVEGAICPNGKAYAEGKAVGV